MPAILGLFLAFLAGGCGEGRNTVLNPGSTRAGFLALPETLQVGTPVADRSYGASVPTGSAPVVRVARTDSVEAIAYLKFGTLPADTTVTGAELALRVRGVEGTDVKLAAYEVTSDSWTESSLTWANRPPLAATNFSLSDRIEPTGTDTTVYVPQVVRIPQAMIRGWITDPAGNYGIALRIAESTASGEVRFLSREAVIDSEVVANPVLTVFRGTSIVAQQSPTQDAFVYQDLRTFGSGTSPALLVEEWIPTRALLRFDIPDSLRSTEGEPPRGFSVNRALLRFHVAGVADAGAILAAYDARSAWTEGAPPDSVELGPLDGSVIIPSGIDSTNADDLTVSLDVGPAVQRWMNGETNDGLVVRMTGEGAGIGAIGLYSREADPTLRPELTVVYSRPIEARWGPLESP